MITGLFLLIFLGDAAAWFEASASSKKTISARAILQKIKATAAAFLPKEYRESYEINSELYEKKPSQYNQYKPEDKPKETAEKKENEPQTVAQEEINLAEQKVPESEPQPLPEEIEEESMELEIVPEEAVEQDPAEALAAKEQQEALEVKEESGDNPLNLKENTSKKGKAGIARNRIKIEGILENPEEQQENQDKDMQVTPEIKTRRIYQGSSPEGKSGSNAPIKPFSGKVPVESGR